MSMISRLIDKLRKSEQEWNQSNMFELAHMCREAADTITELRGALQVASVDYRHLLDENAKLREEFNKMDVWHSKELTAAMDENAKLREESSKHNDLYIHAIADAEVWHLQWSAEHQENEKLRELLQRLLAEYRYMSVRPRKVYMQHEERMRVIEEEMRELGIELQ